MGETLPSQDQQAFEYGEAFKPTDKPERQPDHRRDPRWDLDPDTGKFIRRLTPAEKEAAESQLNLRDAYRKKVIEEMRQKFERLNNDQESKT